MRNYPNKKLFDVTERNDYFKPGVLEVYCGPMKSGKTLALIHRVDKLRYMSGYSFAFFKPDIDTRDAVIKSRSSNQTYNCVKLKAENPYDLFNHINGEALVLFEEAQFFSKDLVYVINELLDQKRNVVVSGLDLDFRGIPFGPMPEIVAMADEVYKLTSICDFEKCNTVARYTQRLINGVPASFDSPIVLVGDKDYYEARCKEHHFVPGRPDKYLG